MYGIFEITSGEFIGFCKSREDADFYIANENLNYEYDRLYTKEIKPLSTLSNHSTDDIKRHYNIIYRFPLVSMDTDIIKSSFSISELQNIGDKDNYIPYIGEDKKTYIRCFSSCISVNITAKNYDEANSISILKLIEILECKKNEELNISYVFNKINNSSDYNINNQQ